VQGVISKRQLEVVREFAGVIATMIAALQVVFVCGGF